MNEVKRCSKLVWNFRTAFSFIWPTPNTADSLRYALTEIGEATDAWLREKRPDHIRNGPGKDSVYDELADTIIMLITALGPRYKYKEKPTNYSVAYPIELAAARTAYALYNFMLGIEWQDNAEAAIVAIWNYPDFQASKTVVHRLDRIYERHIRPTVWTT